MSSKIFETSFLKNYTLEFWSEALTGFLLKYFSNDNYLKLENFKSQKRGG